MNICCLRVYLNVGVLLLQDLVYEVLPGQNDSRWTRESGGSLEERVDLSGRLPALCDAPHHQALAPPAVPGG